MVTRQLAASSTCHNPPTFGPCLPHRHAAALAGPGCTSARSCSPSPWRPSPGPSQADCQRCCSCQWNHFDSRLRGHHWADAGANTHITQRHIHMEHTYPCAITHHLHDSYLNTAQGINLAHNCHDTSMRIPKWHTVQGTEHIAGGEWHTGRGGRVSCCHRIACCHSHTSPAAEQQLSQQPPWQQGCSFPW